MAKTVRFGGYELLSLLGKGGMARVFRAARTGPHGFSKEVALKVLDPTATATPDQIASLTDEARLGGLLRHQNIVATDELGQVGPYYYIAMELVDGWSVDQLLELHRQRSVAIPRSVVLAVLREVCSGLAYAHDLTDPDGTPLGLVHRDMKPGNIMVSRRGEVKVMDFGIAKATTNLYMTQDQTTRGTPLFMSPEQVMGEGLDRRSDLFALGGILHELVTLQPTFAGKEVVPVLRAVLAVDIAAASARIQSAFPQILPVFLRCMQADPRDRYQDARALRMDLQAVANRLEPGISLEKWVRQVGPALPATPTGELGDVLPAGLSPETPAELETPSFSMPLGPGAGPRRGNPTPSHPVDRQLPASSPNLAALAAAPKAPRPGPGPPVTARPAPARRPRANTGSPATWQKRAARKAALRRWLGIALVVVAVVFAGTFVPGEWGDLARSVWTRVTGMPPLSGG